MTVICHQMMKDQPVRAGHGRWLEEDEELYLFFSLGLAIVGEKTPHETACKTINTQQT